VQRVRRLLSRRSVRRSDGMFVAEGAKVLQVALELGAEVESVYLAPEATGAAVALAEAAHQQGARVFDLGPGVLERVAGTVSPQPLLAVVRTPAASTDVLHHARFVVVCVDVRDPGNAGTLVRSAAAAGADAVVCAAGTADPFNPKTVRASAGAVLRLPVLQDLEADVALEMLGAAGLRRVGAVPAGGHRYGEVDWVAPCAVVLGNEAAGLDPRILALLDDTVTIPMARQVDSLNVSMAGTVLCFEVARQRSNLRAMDRTRAAGGQQGYGVPGAEREMRPW
jgi:TrmH family RNA methyltransferase